MLWGWLPCGLVYTALAWALVASHPIHSALLMLVFGMGTVPAVFAAGTMGGWLGAMAAKTAIRRVAGGALIVVALYVLIDGPRGHHSPHSTTSNHSSQPRAH